MSLENVLILIIKHNYMFKTISHNKQLPFNQRDMVDQYSSISRALSMTKSMLLTDQSDCNYRLLIERIF